MNGIYRSLIFLKIWISRFLLLQNVISNVVTSDVVHTEKVSSGVLYNENVYSYHDDSVANICVILPLEDDRMFSLHRVLPAVNLAVEKVKRQLLKGLEIIVRVADSKCSSAYGPLGAINFYRHNQVSVFMGPVCDYSLAPVARYAPFWNIPVISPGGFAHDMSYKQGVDAEFPTLTRIGINFNSLSEFIVGALIESFSWTRAFVLYDVDGLSHITPKFCYLAAASLSNRTKDVRFFYKFELFKPHEVNIESKLRTGPKEDYSSEFSFSILALIALVFVITLTNKLCLY